MSILHDIVTHKRQELSNRKACLPTEYWITSPLYARNTVSLSERLRSKSAGGIIAEFKRRSPSRPSINAHSTVDSVARGYEQAGVAGMSVLTDSHFFGGSLEDLLQARASCGLPLLRKDFVIDSYQIHEARAFGADVILLIAAILEPGEAGELAALVRELDMECLLEVHTLEELVAFRDVPVDMIGVNNRDLKTFEVSLETSLRLFDYIPESVVAVSESGLGDSESLHRLQRKGFRGFLMGEHFMKGESPGNEAAGFIEAYHQYQQDYEG